MQSRCRRSEQDYAIPRAGAVSSALSAAGDSPRPADGLLDGGCRSRRAGYRRRQVGGLDPTEFDDGTDDGAKSTSVPREWRMVNVPVLRGGTGPDRVGRDGLACGGMAERSAFRGSVGSASAVFAVRVLPAADG